MTAETQGAQSPSRARRFGRLAAAALAGFLVAFSLPPWGFWPLGLVGLAIATGLLRSEDRPKSRARLGFVVGLAWFSMGCGWMYHLTAPGYVVAVLLFSSMLAVAAAVAARGPWWMLTLPVSLSLAEALRFSWPFGGVPLATLPMSQVSSPLSSVARLGGPVLLTYVSFTAGAALAALFHRGSRIRSLVTFAVVGAAVLGAAIAPSGRVIGSTTMALVQGGGPQGTRAINDDSREVFRRHELAAELIPDNVDVVVWPENVITVPQSAFGGSELQRRVSTLAATNGVPFVVGVTDHPDGDDSFVNSQVVVMPDGTLADMYTKVRRVPFGEYIPFRGALKQIGVDPPEIPRDATSGTGPAIVDVPGVGRFAVAISWEIFFGGRGRDGVKRGGTILLNPTNGSSYTGTVLQSQQVASSRLRAIEAGRWVAQVSPTGFTAFVSPDGRVYDRTGQREQAVRIRTVEQRTGLTPYMSLGDRPFIVALAVALIVLEGLRRRRRSAPGLDSGQAVTGS